MEVLSEIARGSRVNIYKEYKCKAKSTISHPKLDTHFIEMKKAGSQAVDAIF